MQEPLVQGTQAGTRWQQAGRRPRRMYWLRPGTVFDSKDLMAFCGLHTLQQQVYFYPSQPALAILVQDCNTILDEMVVKCTCDAEGSRSLQRAHQRLSYVRVVSQSAGKYIYHGVWMITKVERPSAEVTAVVMISMPDLP